MGGHHHEPFEVPHYSVYNNTNLPHINEYRKRLDRLGLKDPHIRNVVFRLDPKFGIYKTVQSVMWKICKPGILYGFPLVVGVVALEEDTALSSMAILVGESVTERTTKTI